MKIELNHIKIKDLIEGYIDNADNGVVAYSGKLNVRPPYQREFIYKDKQRNAVIDTIRKGFPLNIMYWVKNPDNTYEILDGQQRTISICQYIKKEYSINYQYFHNLTKEEKEQILNYELMVYICEGNDKEKLEWFKTINIAGEKLTEQELRNATYYGKWCTEAKKYFSKRECVAFNLAKQYMAGSTIRQDYLETALKWIADRDNIEIEEYMAKHQNDTNADDLWLYFRNVISWIETKFKVYRKEMKGIDWGLLYNKYKDLPINSDDIEKEIAALMEDEEVTNKKGIYNYILTKDDRHLNLRKFTDKDKRIKYEEQKGICPYCKQEGKDKVYDISEMEADHIVPWSKGGKTTIDNCQLLCKYHNGKKSNK